MVGLSCLPTYPHRFHSTYRDCAGFHQHPAGLEPPNRVRRGVSGPWAADSHDDIQELRLYMLLSGPRFRPRHENGPLHEGPSAHNVLCAAGCEHLVGHCADCCDELGAREYPRRLV